MDKKSDVFKGSKPQTLLNRLCRVTQSATNVEFQIFRGFENPNIYCYITSFFQLFFHCPEVINYIGTNKKLNQTEKLLRNLLDKIFSKNPTKTVSIQNFINHFNHWNGNNPIPEGQQDASEFAKYLLESLSKNLSDLFSFIIDDSVIGNLTETNFILNCKPNQPDIQRIINNKFCQCHVIDDFHSYLFIYLERNFNKRRKSIKINSFIKIDDNVYKFKGAILYK